MRRTSVAPAEAGKGRCRGDLEQPGSREDRRGGGDLRRVEVAEIRQRVRICGRAARVVGGACLAVRGGSIDDDELDTVLVQPLEGKLGPAKDVSPRPAGWAGERQAGVDAGAALVRSPTI